MIELMVFIGVVVYVKAIILCIWIYSKNKHLTDWLKDQAPMTWEVYNRVGKTGCECDELCNQGRNCKNTR
jgi:hypothetical protein